MKKAKFADKMTDLVEETLVSMGQSDNFTIDDNLDAEFSMTLEHDLSHRSINFDLTEMHHTKEEEDVKVKDLYRDHVKSRVEEFVNLCLDLARTERYATLSGYEYPGEEEEEDEEDEYDDDDYDEEDEEYDEPDFGYEPDSEDEPDLGPDDIFVDGNPPENRPDYDEDGERVFRDDIRSGHETPVFGNLGADQNEVSGVKISAAKDVLPRFLQNDVLESCVFVEFKDPGHRPYALEAAVYELVKEKLNGRDAYIALLDDKHLMCVAGAEPDYLKQMLKDMKDTGINIKDTDLYCYEAGALAHVFGPNGEQIRDIADEEETRE